jgi:hypothetical protein
LPKQNIQNGRMCAKDAIFVFQVFSVPSHISVSLSLIRQVAWLLGKLMVDNIIYQIKRYLCITNINNEPIDQNTAQVGRSCLIGRYIYCIANDLRVRGIKGDLT